MGYETTPIEDQYDNSTGSTKTLSINSDANAEILFKWFSDNTNVEWGLGLFINDAGGKFNSVSTSSRLDQDYSLSSSDDHRTEEGFWGLRLVHNHPQGTRIPSGIPGLTDTDGGSDMNFVRSVVSKYEKGGVFEGKPVPSFELYIPTVGEYIPYNINSTAADFK
jgi:hypothetical protein